MTSTTSTALVSLLWIFSFSPLRSQQAHAPDWALVHRITMQGVDALHNFKLIEARRDFDSVISMAPADPRGYFFKAMISGYRFAFLKQQTDYDEFREQSRKVIDVSEEILRYNENNSTALF